MTLTATALSLASIGTLVLSTPRRLKTKNSPGASAIRSLKSRPVPLNFGARAGHAAGSCCDPTSSRLVPENTALCRELENRSAVMHRSKARLRPRWVRSLTMSAASPMSPWRALGALNSCPSSRTRNTGFRNSSAACSKTRPYGTNSVASFARTTTMGRSRSCRRTARSSGPFNAGPYNDSISPSGSISTDTQPCLDSWSASTNAALVLPIPLGPTQATRRPVVM